MNLAHFVDACGWTLIHFIWQGAAAGLILAIALLGLPRRRAHARYVAACIALSMMVASTVLTFAWEVSKENPSSSKDLLIEESPAVNASLASPSVDARQISLQHAPSAEILVPSDLTAASETSNAPSDSLDWSARLSGWLAHWMDRLVLLWALGVAMLSARLAINWRAVQSLRASGHPLDNPRWLDSVTRLRKSLGITQTIALLESARIDVPMTLGWLRPAILIPAQMVTGLTSAQIQAILAHELAHIRRHDYLVNLLQNLAETVLFFHPAVWWVSSQIRREREYCCDESASALCDGPFSYARALFDVEMIRSRESLALAASDGSLLDRVRHLTGQQQRRPQASGAVLITLSSATVALLLAVGAQRASAVDGPRDGSPQSSVKSSNDTASTSDARAKAIAVAAHAKAAAIDSLPAFYCEYKYRNGDVTNMTLVDTYSLENLRRAMGGPVDEGKWVDVTGLFAWDKQYVLLDEHTHGKIKDGQKNDWHQIKFGDPHAGWSREQRGDQSPRYYRRTSIQSFVENTNSHLQFIEATPRQYWWGDNHGFQSCHSPVPAALVDYRHLGDEEIDGERCDIVESRGRAERLWIGRESGLIRAALYYIFQGRMNTTFHQHAAVQRVAGREFSSREEYRQWYEEHEDKLSDLAKAELTMAFTEMFFEEMARPSQLIFYRDYREIAPGVWLPYKEDRTVWLHSHLNDEKFKYVRSEARVQEASTVVSLEQRIAALMPKDGDFVQDQRIGDATVEYKWRDNISPEEIERLVEKKRLELENSRQLIKELKAPMQKLVGQPAPKLTAGEWIGAQPKLEGKPYLIHFWATWCGPCKNDFEILKSIAKTRQVVGLHPAGVPHGKVVAEVQDSGLNYPTFVAADSEAYGNSLRKGIKRMLPKANISEQDLVGGYPTTMYPYCVVVTADGRIAAHGSLRDVAETFGSLHASSDVDEAKDSKTSNDPPASREVPKGDSNAAAKSRTPWTAVGKIVDQEGKPVSGATVTAFTGFGTLHRTGMTTTDAQGRYTLPFGPGLRTTDGVSMQAATITARKPGNFEVNLSRQGDMVAALRMPDGFPEKDNPWKAKRENLFLPGISKEINFTLAPSARAAGRLTGEDGKPLDGYTVSLVGEELPPSSDCAMSVKTGADGRFELSDVPSGFDFQIQIRGPVQGSPWKEFWTLAAMRFLSPKEGWELQAIRDGHEIVAERFEIRLRGQGENWRVLRESPSQEAIEPPEALSQARVEAKMIRIELHNSAANEDAKGNGDQDEDGGSKSLRKLDRDSASHVDALKLQGYKLAEDENLKRIAAPFPDARSQWYRVAHPTQHSAIPSGPDSLIFHWKRNSLKYWGMSFGENNLESVLRWTISVYPQEIEGPRDLLDAKIPGDWVVRVGADRERIIADLERIHEPLSATNQQRAAAHDPKLVLPNITLQTGFEFVREKRQVRMLVVERAN